MSIINKRIACVCALTLTVALAGCGKSNKNNSSSSEKDKTSKEVTSSETSSTSSDKVDSTDSASSKEDSSSSESSSDSSEVEESNIGEKLEKTAKIFSEENYTLQCTITSTAFEGAIDLKRVVRGDDMYQLQSEAIGTYGTIFVEGSGYDFDYVCGMYRHTSEEPSLNVIQKVVDLNLLQTNTHEDNSEGAEYDVEEYTYTGDTYITVLNFYFDKDDGSLVKYVTTYSVEGQDDIVETRVINNLNNQIDESVFNTDFTKSLTDFDAMTEDQRLGYCQGICASYGVTTDEMFEMGITTDQFKTIDYDTLFKLIYTYGI